MATFGTTAGIPLRYLLGASKVSEAVEGFTDLAEDLDTKIMGWQEGSGALPAAAFATRQRRKTDDGSMWQEATSSWVPLPQLWHPYVDQGLITVNTEQTPSTTRPVAVLLVTVMTGPEASCIANIVCGGSFVASISGWFNVNGQQEQNCASFIVKPGEKWKWEVSSGSAMGVYARYKVL